VGRRAKKRRSITASGPWWAIRSSEVRLQAVRDLVHAKQELQTALTPNPNKEEATNINDLMGAI